MRSLSRIIKAYGPVASSFVQDELPYMPPQSAPAEEQANQMLEQALQRAKQIVQSAQNFSATQKVETERKIQQESEDAKKRGYREGYAYGSAEGEKAGRENGERKGYEDGLRRAAAENSRSVAELGRMIESVERSKTQILEKFENDLGDLAISIAKAILKNELKTNQKALRSIIVNALDSYRNQEWVRIYVSAEAAPVLLKADASIAEDLKEVSSSIRVLAGEGMKEGDCVLETPDRVIDASIDSQLKKLKNAIESAALQRG